MARGCSVHIAAGAFSSFRWGSRLRPLPGAVADAQALAALAASRSFDGVALIDQQARFDVVRRVISTAASDLGDGDTFALTFSGHGLAGQRRGVYQQSWCLFDDPLMRFGDEGLDALLARFAPGVRIFVLANCCHSGAPEGPTPPTPAIRAHVVRLSACAIGESANGTEGECVSPFVARVLEAANAARDFASFFESISSDGRPQLEIGDPRSDEFLAAGPFRLHASS